MEEVLEFLEAHAPYFYPILFAGVFLENAGLPVPGETTVLVGGFWASASGKRRLNIVAVILVTLVAAVLGDNMGFWLGRRYARPRLQSGKRFLFLTNRTLALAEGYFHRFGSWTIFFARFITGLRVVGAMAAGTAGMPWPRFLLANACGAITWAVTISLVGYYFGENLPLLEKIISRAGMIALAAVVLLVGFPLLLRVLMRWLTGRPETLAEPDPPGKDQVE